MFLEAIRCILMTSFVTAGLLGVLHLVIMATMAEPGSASALEVQPRITNVLLLATTSFLGAIFFQRARIALPPQAD